MEKICMYIIIILYQSFISSYTVERYLTKEEKINNKKLILTLITYFFTNNILLFKIPKFSVCILIMHIISLIILGSIYLKKAREFIVVYSILHYFQVFYITLVSMLFNKNINILYEIRTLSIMAIILTMYFILTEELKYLFDKVLSEKQSIRMVIWGSFLLDFMFIFNMILHNQNQDLLEKVSYILFNLFIILVLIYTFSIYKRSKLIFDLNYKLEIRNIELRNMKNDYANKINYIFSLYTKDEKEEICKVLKKIINNEIDDFEEVKIQSYKEKKSLIDTALSDAIKLGIDVEVKEKCDIDLADIDGMELYRIIINIINNAIKAMNGKGKIRVETDKVNENIIIKIGNNGPKIDEEYIDKIFETGFTTKPNKDKSHGYGLGIVKELLEHNKGSIQVKSSVEFTEFIINLPIREGKY